LGQGTAHPVILDKSKAGGNDYFKWKYTFTLAYAGTIREGVNRITAKLVCQANPINLTKFYSINLTGMNGIVPKQFSAITRSNTAVTLLSSSSSSLSYQTPLINQSLPTSSNSSVSSDSSSGNHDNIYGKDHHNGMSRYHYHSMPPWGAVNIMAATVQSTILRTSPHA